MIAVCLASGPGCARDLARASSGAIGCSYREIAVSHVSVGWSQMSWTAVCRGQTFYCSGENAPTCSPELEPARRGAPQDAPPPTRSEPERTLPTDAPPPDHDAIDADATAPAEEPTAAQETSTDEAH